MFKKNKQLIIGFLLGALLFTIIPVKANISDYMLKESETKIILDGKEIGNKELPVLIMDPGYNYIPISVFREISKTIDLEFQWIAKTNQIEINTRQEPKRNNTSERTPTHEEVIVNTDNENIISVNGETYISQEGVNAYLRDFNKDKVKEDARKERIYMSPFHDNTTKIYTIDKGDVIALIDNIPTKRVYGDHFYSGSEVFIEYSFFENSILPLLE